MEKIKPLMKKWWFWVICVVVVVGVVGAISGGGDTDTTTDNSSMQSPSPTPKEEFDWTTAEVTSETVEQILSESRLRVTEPINIFIVEMDSGEKEVRLTVDISAHSGDMAMRGLFKYLNEYSAVIFENPNVAQVMVRGQITMVDTNGNKTPNDATHVVWTRATAENINHENYNDIAMGSQYPSCFETADEYFIHNSIFQKMKEAGDIPSSKSMD